MERFSSSDNPRFLSSSSSYDAGVRVNPSVMVGEEGSYCWVERTADAVDDGRGFETDVMRLLLVMLLLPLVMMMLLLLWMMVLQIVGVVELGRYGSVWVRRRRGLGFVGMMLVAEELGKVLVVRVEGRVATVDGSEMRERRGMVRLRQASAGSMLVKVGVRSLRGGRRRVGCRRDLRLSLLERNSRLTCLELTDEKKARLC